ncbi:MAG: O-antigen ligase family protein [Bacteroidales bacterium]|nr:O-antigen ligase family protein [Bacteroidales bacterium]
MNAHISHIRFSLNAVFAIFILFYYAHSKDIFVRWQRILFILTAFWFLFIMFYLKYSTGIAIFLIMSFLMAIYFAFKASRLSIKLLLFVSGLSLILVPGLYFLKIAREFRSTEAVDFTKLELYTPNGNSYYHDTVNFKVENGSYTGLYICDKELRKSWLERSSVSIDSLDSKQQYIRYTLIRYLASKQLRKDSIGIAQLSRQDIRNIEAGLTNSKSRQWFQIRPQIENLLTGWDNYRYHNNPNSSSLIQRIEYWRSSLQIIKQHPLFGVGTGDVPEAFKNYYRQANSMLDQQFRLRSHNQFLSITVAFGVFGLIWFLFVLFYPMIKVKTYQPYFYLIFWCIFFISIFTEDTLETQEGVTFYAFLTSLLLFGWRKPDVKETGQSKS